MNLHSTQYFRFSTNLSRTFLGIALRFDKFFDTLTVWCPPTDCLNSRLFKLVGTAGLVLVVSRLLQVLLLLLFDKKSDCSEQLLSGELLLSVIQVNFYQIVFVFRTWKYRGLSRILILLNSTKNISWNCRSVNMTFDSIEYCII